MYHLALSTFGTHYNFVGFVKLDVNTFQGFPAEVFTTCYCHITTLLLPHYCFIITRLLDMNVHFFKLLQDHYYIITLYYCRYYTLFYHYYSITASLLQRDFSLICHYYILITTSL